MGVGKNWLMGECGMGGDVAGFICGNIIYERHRFFCLEYVV